MPTASSRPSLRWLFALLESRYFPAACLLVGFLLRFVWILLVDPKPVSDFDWYFAKGMDISQGRGYHAHGAPSAFWPVGYPLFLAGLFSVFGRSILAARIANILLYTGILALSYGLAQRLFRSVRTARLTLLLLTFYPNHIAYSSLVASEILFTFLMLLGIAVLLLADTRFLMSLLAGAIFGLACLVRPQLLPLPAAFVFLLLGAGRPFRKTLLTLAGVYAALVIVLLPWTLRNYRAFGHFVFVSTNGGGNLLIGNNPWANGAYVDRPEFAAIVGTGNEYEQDRRAGSYAIDYMRKHPVETVKRWPSKFWYLYRGDIEGFRWSLEGIEARGKETPAWLGTGAVALGEAYYLALGAACIASLLLFSRAGPGGFGGPRSMGLVIIAFFTLLGLAFYGGSRYHFPIMPWVAMYAAALPEAWRNPRKAR